MYPNHTDNKSNLLNISWMVLDNKCSSFKAFPTCTFIS